MKEQNARCPFMISNTDRLNKDGTHWQSVLDLHARKEIFLFDSFGFSGLKKL